MVQLHAQLAYHDCDSMGFRNPLIQTVTSRVNPCAVAKQRQCILLCSPCKALLLSVISSTNSMERLAVPRWRCDCRSMVAGSWGCRPWKGDRFCIWVMTFAATSVSCHLARYTWTTAVCLKCKVCSAHKFTQRM